MTEQQIQQPLRVALYFDDDEGTAWACKLIECLTASDDIQIVGFIRAPDRRAAQRASNDTPGWRNGRLRRGIRARLQRVYRKLVDRNAFVVDAWAPADLPKDASWASVELEQPVSPAQLNALRDMQLDVIVICGRREVPAEVISIPKYGVWSILGSPASLAHAYPAGFWPALAGEKLTRSVLAVTFADRAPVVLFDSWMATSRHSTRDNISRYYWKMLFAVPRSLQRLRELGASRLIAESHSRYAQSLPRNNATGNPSALRYAFHVLHAITRKAIELVDTNLFEQRWRLRQAERYSASDKTELGNVLDNPPLCYRADPFLFAAQGQDWLFFEEYCDTRKLGHLSVLALDSTGRPVGEAKVVLQMPYHLSYPQVFEWQGSVYMLPETSSNKTVELYKASRFPDEWELHSVLMKDIDASDATILFHQDRWWLFANVKNHEAVSSQDECFLYFSDSLSGPWIPHPLNPVVSDCRTSRPAGAMFEWNGRLIRPTQDSTFRYGYGLNFMEVTELNEHAYSEVLLEHVPPDRRSRAIGIHTFAQSGAVAYVDELYRSPRWKNQPEN